MLNQGVFRIETGLDQIFGQVYRIWYGTDYKMKILDWIRIAKISDPCNTTRWNTLKKKKLKHHRRNQTPVVNGVKICDSDSTLL